LGLRRFAHGGVGESLDALEVGLQTLERALELVDARRERQAALAAEVRRPCALQSDARSDAGDVGLEARHTLIESRGARRLLRRGRRERAQHGDQRRLCMESIAHVVLLTGVYK
jgi:hypothetical protein